MPELELSRDRSFFRTSYRVDGVIDLELLATGLGDDEELLARLEAEGVDVAALDVRLLGSVSTALALGVDVTLPGGEEVSVKAEPGETVVVAGSSEVTDTRRIVLLLVATGLAVLGLIVMTRLLRRR